MGKRIELEQYLPFLIRFVHRHFALEENTNKTVGFCTGFFLMGTQELSSNVIVLFNVIDSDYI